MTIKNFPLSALVAGFIAVLVGYTGSAAIVFQAAQSAGASEQVISSWMGALGIGMALTTIGFSLRYRAPVLTAWSTPGAAVLVSALLGVSLPEAIGAFLFSAALITLFGITGWFEKVMDRVPMSLAAAMLAGVLARFGMDVFVSMQSDLALVLPMFMAYLLLRKLTPRFVIVIVFAGSVALAGLLGMLDFSDFEMMITRPVLTIPSFSLATMLSVGIPLFAVTMASQNIPGVAVLRTSGYDIPVSPLITWTGLTTLVLAPFGCYAINLAAITAAICSGEEAHPDRDKRYIASLSAGVCYALSGIFAASIAALFFAFPGALVLSIAGLALLGTIGNSLHLAMAESASREAALITFLVTLSGVTLFGVGSAFWGLVAGAISLLVLTSKRS